MLSPERIAAIAEQIAAMSLSEHALSQLRSAHSDIHFTYCMDDDVTVQHPYLSRPGFNLYLVDGREHCLKFTSNLEHATGLVVAEVIEDD